MISTKVSSPRSATPTVARAGKSPGASHRFQALSISDFRLRSVKKMVADSKRVLSVPAALRYSSNLVKICSVCPSSPADISSATVPPDEDKSVVHDDTMHYGRLNMTLSHLEFP